MSTEDIHRIAQTRAALLRGNYCKFSSNILLDKCQGDADINGTLEADAITINGTAIGSIYGVVAGSSSIVTTGALDAGSISSGFGNIDVGSSNLTATGTISLGATSFNDNNITNVGNIALDSLTADGSSITITGDTTFADGAYDFDIASHDTSNGLKLGGTLVTATAAELNYVDGVTSNIQTQLNNAATTLSLIHI